MKPTDVLPFQRVMYEQSVEFLMKRRGVNLEEDREVAANSLIRMIAGTGDPYYVASDMTSVAEAASLTMERQDLLEGDWPSRRGFLLFDRTADLPDGHEHVDGFAWAIDRQAGAIILPLALKTVDSGTFVSVCIPQDGYLTWQVGSPPQHDAILCTPLLLATWTIMQQKFAARDSTPVDRSERRRCMRLSMPQSVTVVRVRSREQKSNDHGEAPVEWSHRWLVSGHWRNQYLPSRSTHRQQWIMGYVKGPDDKPLVVKDRVTAWVR